MKITVEVTVVVMIGSVAVNGEGVYFVVGATTEGTAIDDGVGIVTV